MTRLITLIVALVSLVSFNARLTFAQSSDSTAVEPTSAPQELNEPVSGNRTSSAIANRHAEPTRTDTRSAESAEPAPASPAQPEQPASIVGSRVVVKPGETVNAVDVHNGDLLLAGHVNNDVIAVNSSVEIKPGASVSGLLLAYDSKVDNEAGSAVHVVEPEARFDRREWVDGQVGLLGLGLVGGLALLILAPKASQQVATGIGVSPARSLAVGLIASLGLLFMLLVDGVALRSPVGLLWAPIGYVFALTAAVLFGSGWICAMSFAGDHVATKLGRSHRPISLFTRAAVGFCAFCALNIVLGAVHPGLGMIGLLCEAVLAIMGLGSICISGFGADPNWLTNRLRGENRHISWRRDGW